MGKARISVEERAMRHEMEELGVEAVRPREDPTRRPLWASYPDWAKLRLLADAWAEFARAIGACAPAKAAKRGPR